MIVPIIATALYIVGVFGQQGPTIPDSCTNVFCPTSNVPEITFPVSGGTATGTSNPCCVKQFDQCQTVAEKPTCREILQYKIQGESANSGGICQYGPSTTASCQCQEHYEFTPNFALKFCPKQATCCSECECHGDPHCQAFGTAVAHLWSVCDDRNVQCLHDKNRCKATTYEGTACVWNEQLGVCQRSQTSPIPSMLMYSKDYVLNGATKTFSVNLNLGYYGSITDVFIKDEGSNVDYHFSFTSNGQCTHPLPLDHDNTVLVTGLASNVLIKLKCYAGASPLGRRWDVLYIREPNLAAAQNAKGFCKVNAISEQEPNEGSTLCAVIDKQLSRALKDRHGKPLCGAHATLDGCKRKWCSLHWGSLGFIDLEDCYKYVTSAQDGDEQNFLQSVCASSPIVTSSGFDGKPDECKSNKVCKYCMDDITDYPNQIADNLAPTPPCPDLISVGLHREKLSSINDGVEIDFLKNGVWTPIFALLDSELASCGCGNLTSTNPIFTNPGQYRVIQCAGFNPGTPVGADLCDSNPGYTTTVKYLNPGAGSASYSTSLKVLFDNGQLVCNPNLYKNCPNNYRCCGFSRKTQFLSWSTCMLDEHPRWETTFPKCGNGNS